MSKIVSAVNAMIANSDRIKSVRKKGKEIFFVYGDKYKWSIVDKDGDDYWLFYYSGNESISDLYAASVIDFDFIDYVKYSSSEIGSAEAEQSFAELYMILNEMANGMNDVLDDIIGSGDGTF